MTDCRCGHARDAHQHYRPGADCALCDCGAFRLALARLIRRLVRR